MNADTHTAMPHTAMPRTAVVLCSYDGARFLPMQLDSLRAQSVQPDAYVLSDDASSDESYALLKAFAEDLRAAGCEVVLHRNASNLGYARHFEQALQRADADILFPCDQDDVWHSRKIERMRDVFAARPELVLLHGDARLVDAGGGDLGRRLFEVLEISAHEFASMHAGRGFEVLLRRNIVTGAAMAFRRDVLRHALPVDEGWSHDEWIALNAAMHARIDTLEEVVIDYRQHGDNQIGVREKQGMQKLGVGMDRQAFLQRAKLRGESLAVHAAGADAPVDVRDAIEQRALHARHRANLPAGFAARLRAVSAEARSGRYRRFGRGWRSAIADLLGID